MTAITHKEQFGYQVESAWGVVVPLNPIILLGVNSVDGTQDKQSTQSGMMSTSREVKDIIQVGASGGVQFSTEMQYGALDTPLEVLLGGTWTANVLKVGSVKRSLCLERQFTDITKFHAYKGAIPTSFSLGVSQGKVLTASMAFQSKFPTFGVTTVGTGTTAASVNPVMDPIAHVQLLQEGGAGSIAGASEFSLSIESGIIDQPQLQSLDPVDLNSGQFVVKGSFSLYYTDDTYLTKMSAWTQTSLALTIGGAASLKYAFSIPKVRLTKVGQPSQGPNQAIVQKVDFEAYYDATDTTLKITRTP